MADPRPVNVFDDEWSDGYPQQDGWRANYKRVRAGTLAVGIYELLPGQTQCPYHFHHGNFFDGEPARG